MPLNFPNQYSDKKYNNDPSLHGHLPLMRAKVIANNDPKKIGRVQVRIPSYHGIPGKTDRSIPDKSLPWAMPCFYGGSGQDMGSFIVPIPGTFVWVVFEDNDVDKPVYIGGVPSMGSTLIKTMNNLGDYSSPSIPWLTEPGQPDIPFDEFEGKITGVPERPIIYKSQKGHTIMCDDSDGYESLSIIDRLGQIIKFFSGVTRDKNLTKYRRGLHSAEKGDQLGDGVVEEPSIMLRSGVTEDAEKVHSMIRIFRNKMRGESIDADNVKRTTTDYSPTEFNQQTQNSRLNMTGDHILMEYPNIREYFCDSYYSVKAFNKCHIECTDDHMLFQFNGHGLYIDNDSVKLVYKDTTLVETQNEIKINAKDLFSIEAAGTKLEGNKDHLYGKGKEIKFEGSGSIYTEGDKTYIIGTEVHFKKK